MCFRKGALKGVLSHPFSREKRDYTLFYGGTHLLASSVVKNQVPTVLRTVAVVAVVAAAAAAAAAVVAAVVAAVEPLAL